MTDFIIKSGIAMLVLLAVYHLFLEKEKMHRFNRFYLLGALAFSLVLPLITIPVYEKIDIEAPTEVLPDVVNKTAIQEASVNYWPYIILVLYTIITLLFLVRFLYTIWQFKKLKRNSETRSFKRATLVLVDKEILPHTFLNNIFISKESYENKVVEPELFTHEFAHINQKHTFDILFVEVLKTLFWFNPLLYFYKRAIQLNHEFLADESVVTASYNIINYQQLLLQKAVSATDYRLASSLTFSVTKKRLIMMTKTTSTKKAFALKAGLAPVGAALLFLLCTKTVAQQANPVAYQEKNEKELKEVYGNTHFKFIDKNGTAVEKSYANLTPAEKKDLPLNPAVKTDYIEFNESGGKEQAAIEKAAVRNYVGLTGRVFTMDELSYGPEYPKGPTGFYEYIIKNFKVPDELKGDVKMVYSFIVEKDGSISNAIPVKDAGFGTKEQITAILEGSEKWTPGKKDNEAVRSVLVLPIIIKTSK